jgi:protein tyrosine phosphatase
MMIENQDVLSCSEGAKPSNRLKNRYKDVLPCKWAINRSIDRIESILDNKSRVILEVNNDSDYINASFIEVRSLFFSYMCIECVF